MAKAKGQTKQNKVVRQKQKKPVVRVAGSVLDQAAKDYGRLLADPCYSRIVQPVYAGSGSGQLVRVESDFILGAEATSVGAAVIFTPGIINASAGSCGVIIPTTVVASDSGTIAWTSSFARAPGVGMASIFGSVRAVAACLQVQYVGAEQTRAGVVGLAQMSRGAAAQLTTLADLRSVSERVVRTPDGILEIKLAPTADSETFNTVDGAGTGIPNEKNLPSLVVSVSGIPSSTGVRVRLVQVLEWTPKAGSGGDANVTSSDSDNSLSQVLRRMNAANPTWRYDVLNGLAAYAPKALGWI